MARYLSILILGMAIAGGCAQQNKQLNDANQAQDVSPQTDAKAKQEAQGINSALEIYGFRDERPEGAEQYSGGALAASQPTDQSANGQTLAANSSGGFFRVNFITQNNSVTFTSGGQTGGAAGATGTATGTSSPTASPNASATQNPEATVSAQIPVAWAGGTANSQGTTAGSGGTASGTFTADQKAQYQALKTANPALAQKFLESILGIAPTPAASQPAN